MIFKILKNQKYLLVLFILLLIPLIDLLQPGLPLTHDGKDHLARIANFYQNLLEGNLVPRWAGFLNWGYGHPILMFLYPLPSYSVSLIHALGFTLVDSLKIFMAATFILSGLSMYMFVKKFIDEKSALLASLLYTIAPYRFVDLYVRGALGEHTAFVFPPLIGYFLFKVKEKYSYWGILGLSLSTSGLVLSHNAVSLMFIPLIALLMLILVLNSKSRKITFFRMILGIVLGFGIASFFWIPALLEAKYTLRNIVIGKEYINSFITINSFIYGVWDYGGTGKFTVQLGIVHLLFVLLSVYLLIVSRDKAFKKIILILLGILTVSLFLMTEYSSIAWSSFSILPKFQFPWRFLTLSVFTASLLGAFVFRSLKLNKTLLLCACILLLFATNFTYWKARSYVVYEDSFFKKNYSGTTDTGESAPRWSVRFMEKGYNAPLEAIEGKIDVKSITRNQTYHLYAVNALSTSKVMENTLYFPGWSIKVDNKLVPIEFQDRHHHGLMTFSLNKGLHKVEVLFEETRLRAISNYLSLVSIFLLLILGILRKAKIWKKYL